MGKTSKWIKKFLTGKKEREREKGKDIVNQPTILVGDGNPRTPLTIPLPTPKEKNRWSFRRSPATEPDHDLKNSTEIDGVTPSHDQHAFAMAAATAAAMVAVKAADVVIQLNVAASGRAAMVEEAATIKIQSYYRAYLARKALNALRGLVKLQALVRGHLIRKQAAETLRCMQALVTVQAKARAQRLWMVEESRTNNQRQFNHRKSAQENRSRPSYRDFDRGMEEDVKIVEIDESKGRISNSNHEKTERFEHRIHTHCLSLKQEHEQISPAPSAITDLSRANSGHFDEYSIDTAQISPPYYAAISKPDSSRIPFSYAGSDYEESLSHEYSFNPSYMANTKSSRAKVRSQSAPKQRPELFDRQPNRRRTSLEGRNVPRGVKMHRSSSQLGLTAQNYQYPGSIKLDRSTFSLKGSECGSTSTVLTNTNYCRSLVGLEVHGSR